MSCPLPVTARRQPPERLASGDDDDDDGVGGLEKKTVPLDDQVSGWCRDGGRRASARSGDEYGGDPAAGPEPGQPKLGGGCWLCCPCAAKFWAMRRWW